jgi:hypothetical protein
MKEAPRNNNVDGADRTDDYIKPVVCMWGMQRFREMQHTETKRKAAGIPSRIAAQFPMWKKIRNPIRVRETGRNTCQGVGCRKPAIIRWRGHDTHHADLA